MTNEQITLIDQMIESRLCVSRAEARRLILTGYPENKIREKIEKIKIVNYNQKAGIVPAPAKPLVQI